LPLTASEVSALKTGSMNVELVSEGVESRDEVEGTGDEASGSDIGSDVLSVPTVETSVGSEEPVDAKTVVFAEETDSEDGESESGGDAPVVARESGAGGVGSRVGGVRSLASLRADRGGEFRHRVTTVVKPLKRIERLSRFLGGDVREEVSVRSRPVNERDHRVSRKQASKDVGEWYPFQETPDGHATEVKSFLISAFADMAGALRRGSRLSVNKFVMLRDDLATPEELSLARQVLAGAVLPDHSDTEVSAVLIWYNRGVRDVNERNEVLRPFVRYFQGYRHHLLDSREIRSRLSEELYSLLKSAVF